eukprot:EG_transcript_21274
MHRRSCSPPVVAGGTGFRAAWISADALTFFISFIAGMVSCTMLLPASPFAATAAWVRATGAPSWTSATGHVPARAGVLLRHAAPKDGFADVAWAGGEPRSARFGDVYFSAAGGLAEARHVFLRGTGLAGRIAARPVLTIAETGFGTGLNFLAAWQLWDSCEKPAGATLQFVTVDKYPLRPSDLATALEAFPELQPYSQPRPLPNRGPGTGEAVLRECILVIFGLCEDPLSWRRKLSSALCTCYPVLSSPKLKDCKYCFRASHHHNNMI